MGRYEKQNGAHKADTHLITPFQKLIRNIFERTMI